MKCEGNDLNKSRDKCTEPKIDDIEYILANYRYVQIKRWKVKLFIHRKKLVYLFFLEEEEK